MLSQKISDWMLDYEEYHLAGSVPCSMYSILLDHQKIEHPYYRMNEKKITLLSEKDCEMTSAVMITEEMLAKKHLDLVFYGLDTLCDIYFNGKKMLYADNMYRTWRVDVKNEAVIGENTVRLHFYSPSEYITRKNKEHFLFAANVGFTLGGIGHIRKASCMFGWDWGPILPDMGLYRDVMLEAYEARIDSVEIRQIHENGNVTLTLALDVTDRNTEAKAVITSPDGEKEEHALNISGKTEILIDEPKLWWPNGLGDQPLYTVEFILEKDGEIADTVTKTIGLRTLAISTEKDEYGEEFCHVVNGKKFFAMGADYIPEENILAWGSPEKTEKLIKSCVKANFNSLRVWGGGFYPNDCFYELCDRYGLVVWQDFMFACMNVLMSEEFTANVTAEFIDVLKRIRHHACLGLLCGNNEMEEALVYWSSCRPSKTQKVIDDYLFLYEDLLPKICSEYAPDIFYWPASPSSHGGFDDPRNENVGDMHYWQVWHGGVPFEEYRKHYFRYCSEFGFEAFPMMKTLKSFALPEDMALDSDVMHSHQKCHSGNEKILAYVKDYYKIPEDFGKFVYLSQILQADAIRYGVEHFRRYRGRCMGALYWQLNDCWPVVSWASIDYYGRWKALHYRARKFFAPVLISLHETETEKIVNLSNETLQTFRGKVTVNVKNNRFDVLASYETEISVSGLSSKDIVLPNEISAMFDRNADTLFLEYTLEKDGEIMERDGKIYVKPCEYRFADPQLSYEIREENGAYYLDLTAKAFAKNVMIEWENADVTPEDNFFDITDGKASILLDGKKEDILSEMPKILSVYDVQ
ncbi:MAG: glycoside hydrolase family 2 protein [Clostridia bacterium]|nr:glycoside hydrolase family 2 protein [Clostridia bacterium]